MSGDLLILLMLLACSAFFSGSETSLTTLGRAKLKVLSDKGNKTASVLEALLETPGKLLATILVGNNLVNIAFTVFSTTVLLRFFKENGLAGTASSTFLITLLLSFVILVFGEIIPKMIALSKSERFAFVVARPVFLLEKTLAPLVMVTNGLAKFVVKRLGINVLEKGQFITEEELKTLIAIGREEGVLEEDEQQMLTGIFDLGETVVREIMTPRVDMVCIDVTTPLEEILALVSEKGHSRLPMYAEKRDNIIGILYAKDLLKVSLGVETSVRGLLRPVQFVPETKKIDDLLKKMRTKRSHIAIVVDEHGGVSGLVTIEDILEEIVGDIADEHENISAEIVALEDGSWLVNGSVDIEELEDLLKIIFITEGSVTIAGFLAEKLQHLPKKGERLFYEGYCFQIQQASIRRVFQVLIFKDEEGSEQEKEERSEQED